MTDIPAFPSQFGFGCSEMSLRDYLAAKAMQAYVEHDCFVARDGGEHIGWDQIAADAYEQADAMLSVRAKWQGVKS